MDPAGTLLSIAQIVVILTDFADSFDEAPRSLNAIRAQIKVVETGVKRVQEWLHFTDPTSRAAVQDSLQEAIATVDDSVGSLKVDMELILRSGPKMSKILGRQGSDKWTQTKYAWNEAGLRKHLTDMRECALLLSFTLTVCQLPLGQPAHIAIEELSIGARTLSRAHKSTRDKRRFMLAEAKTHAPEDQSVDFKLFLEGVLAAETMLPDESESEEPINDHHSQASSVAQASQESATSNSLSPVDLSNQRIAPGDRLTKTQSDELFLDGPMADAKVDPISPPKISRNGANGNGTLLRNSSSIHEKEPYSLTTHAANTQIEEEAWSTSPSNTGISSSPYQAMAQPQAGFTHSLSHRTLPRKPINPSLRSDHACRSPSSDKIMVMSEESVPPEKAATLIENMQKQVHTDEPSPSRPPPYLTPRSSQAFQTRSVITSARSGSGPSHINSISEKHPIRHTQSYTDDVIACPEIIQAVRYSQIQRVQDMIRQGDNVHATDPETGRTALLEAVYQSHRELCRVLLTEGSRADHQDTEGRTALHLAAMCNDSVICRMLLAENAQVSTKDRLNRTPLQLAAENGSHDVVTALLEVTPCQMVNDGEVVGPFLEAVKYGNVSSAEAFIVKHIDLKTFRDPWKLPTHAAISGSTRMLDLVLVRKSDFKATDPAGLSALHYAAKHGHPTMIERLLDTGLQWKSQTNKRKESALHLAIVNNQLPAALALIQHKNAKVTMTDADDQEPIHLATRTGDFELVTALLSRGAKLKSKSSYGWRPPHIAAAYGHIALMANFITHGIDIDDRISSPSFKPGKKTNEAAQQGCWAEIRWPHENARALHLAIEFGHPEMAKLLLASGAKVDSPDSQRWQPLHYAAFHCEPEVVELLLEKGASPHAKTQDGNTPIGLGFREHGLTASSDDRERVLFLLQNAGVKQQKSALNSVKHFRLGGAGTRSARERNMVWHTAEMAEALYRDREIEDGEETSDRSSAMSPSLNSSFDRRTSNLSSQRSLG